MNNACLLYSCQRHLVSLHRPSRPSSALCLAAELSTLSAHGSARQHNVSRPSGRSRIYRRRTHRERQPRAVWMLGYSQASLRLGATAHSVTLLTGIMNSPNRAYTQPVSRLTNQTLLPNPDHREGQLIQPRHDSVTPGSRSLFHAAETTSALHPYTTSTPTIGHQRIPIERV